MGALKIVSVQANQPRKVQAGLKARVVHYVSVGGPLETWETVVQEVPVEVLKANVDGVPGPDELVRIVTFAEITTANCTTPPAP